MSGEQTELLQGTLDLLILKALALQEMHGLQISRRIEQVTKGTFRVKPGSLFPVAAPHGGRRLAGFFLGRVGKPPKGQVLQADTRGPATTGNRSGALEANFTGDGEGAGGWREGSDGVTLRLKVLQRVVRQMQQRASDSSSGEAHYVDLQKTEKYRRKSCRKKRA